ncbi:OmpA family protein [Romboutsia sp.]|uniref:OmpA family protein n=1 Tax=Romboutsia sp. TaxID=1965302 RepID=UPI003F325D20
MSRKKRRGNSEDDINPDAWLATYSDTITLVLTFFILLYSISSVDSQKLKELSEALQGSLSGTVSIKDIENIGDIDSTKVNPSSGGNTEYENLVEKLNTVIENNSLTDVVKIREEDRGVVLQLDETILFDSGQAALKEDRRNVLNLISTVISNVDNDVLVEGNTDNIPMNTEEFPSNWELSTARAVSVVRYFIEEKGQNPTRFAVKGYGEHKPLVENSTPENRATNRRVDILIVEQKEK